MKRNRPRRTPIPVQRALRNLGSDIRDARLRRRIPAQQLAERAQISRTTLHRIEHGEPGVSMDYYASVLHSIGMLAPLTELMAAHNDSVGLQIDNERLPQRARRPRNPEKPL